MNFQIPTSIRLKSESLEKLKEIGAEKDRSVNYLINQAIEMYLVNQK